MAGAWTSKNMLAADGVTLLPMRMWDESGVGSGPFSFATAIADLTGAGSPAVKAAGVAPVANDKALVVAISPNGQVSGQQAMSASAPVVIASDQTHVMVHGDIASGTTDTNSDPVKIGHVATTSQSGLTLVTNGQRVNSIGGVDGFQLVRTDTNLEDIEQFSGVTVGNTSTQLLAAGAAGVKHNLVDLDIVNTSGTACYVMILDGATEIARIPVGTNGTVRAFKLPKRCTAATALNAQCSAALSTIYVSGSAFKSKV